MKSKYYYRILFIVLSLSVSSCASLRVEEIKKISNLPSKIQTDSISAGKEYTKLELKDFFNDPNLLLLFQKIEKSNPDYQIMLQQMQIANAAYKKSKLAFFPEIDLSISGSGTRYGDYTMEGVGNYDTNLSGNVNEKQRINREVSPNLWLGAQVSWEIDIWGKIRNKKKAAQQRYFASKEGMTFMKNQLFTSVAQLYYQLVSLDKKLAIYQENQAIQQVAHEIVQAQRLAGKATELAVQQFGAQSERMKAEVELLKIEIEGLERSISELTGEYHSNIIRSTTFHLNFHPFLNIQLAADSILHQRPDIAASYHELLASHADAKAARAAFFPSLKIGAYGAMNSFSLASWFNPGSLAWQLLGGVTTPLFKQGQLKYELFVANKEQEIAFLKYQKNVINAYNELSLLLNRTIRYQNIMNLKTQEIQFLDRAVDVSNSLYLTGYANYWEIINSQKLKIQAEIDRVDIEFENANNALLLYKALGGEMK